MRWFHGLCNTPINALKSRWCSRANVARQRHARQLHECSYSRNKPSHHVSNAKHLNWQIQRPASARLLLPFRHECYWPGDKKAEGTIKHLVTEPTLEIEGKGRDVVSVLNYLHLMLASNEDWIVPAGESERRWFMNDVSNARLQDKQWFNAIGNELENGGYSGMLFDLLHYNLRNFHPRDVPEDAGLLDQQRLSLSALDSWWSNYWRSARCPDVIQFGQTARCPAPIHIGSRSGR